MISEKGIQEWWTRKIDNYLKNYTKWNKLSLTQAKTKFFTKTHEKFLEIVLFELRKFICGVHDKS